MLPIKSYIKPFTALLAILLALVLIPDLAHSYGESDARSLGMGGAYTAAARGYQSLQNNPANLGLRDNFKSSWELFSAGAQLRNNAFSLNDYNQYTGAYLTDDDKEEILGKIPSEGLSLNVLSEAGATSFSTNQFAITVTAYAKSDITLPKDPAELILYGNAEIPRVDLGAADGEAWGMADLAVGYGHRVSEWEDGEFTIGIGAHYIRGLIYEEIISAEGYAETGDTSITASGSMQVKSALGGAGYSFDIGMAARFETDYVFSFSILNLVNKVKWDTETEITEYTFSTKAINANTLEEDSISVSDDTTYSIEPFGQKKPAIVKMGLAWSKNNLLLSVDYEQGFSNTASSSVMPELSTGIEFRPAAWMPIRSGLSFGGIMGGYAAFGFGFDFGVYNFDLAVANQGSLTPNGSKGLLFSISSKFNF